MTSNTVACSPEDENNRDFNVWGAYHEQRYPGMPTGFIPEDVWQEYLNQQSRFYEVHPNGTLKQEALPARFDLVPPSALERVAQTLHEGAEKYGEYNWQTINLDDHINHAIAHVYAYLSGDDSEDHLTHAICRLMFASSCSIFGGLNAEVS